MEYSLERFSAEIKLSEKINPLQRAYFENSVMLC
jgi:hypothetical protein